MNELFRVEQPGEPINKKADNYVEERGWIAQVMHDNEKWNTEKKTKYWNNHLYQISFIKIILSTKHSNAEAKRYYEKLLLYWSKPKLKCYYV